MMKFL